MLALGVDDRRSARASRPSSSRRAAPGPSRSRRRSAARPSASRRGSCTSSPRPSRRAAGRRTRSSRRRRSRGCRSRRRSRRGRRRPSDVAERDDRQRRDAARRSTSAGRDRAEQRHRGLGLVALLADQLDDVGQRLHQAVAARPGSGRSGAWKRPSSLRSTTVSTGTIAKITAKMTSDLTTRIQVASANPTSAMGSVSPDPAVARRPRPAGVRRSAARARRSSTLDRRGAARAGWRRCSPVPSIRNAAPAAHARSRIATRPRPSAPFGA